MNSQNIANCHALGLDSIVLRDQAGARNGMLRVFIARPEHELWRNDPRDNETLREHGLSIGMRAHHCDIAMIPLFGDVSNVFDSVRTRQEAGRLIRLFTFQYDSKILGGNGFTATHASRLFSLKSLPLEGLLSLPAETLHTVYVPKGQSAAWLIAEGFENPDHRAVTFSNLDLTSPEYDTRALYQPMGAQRFAENQALLRENGVRPW